MKKVAIQGIKGSFHEDAASRYFKGKVEMIECRSFQKVCAMVDQDEADYAVMAIENSIAGSLLNNYGLMRDYHLRIIGEIYVHIQMNLMVLPGVKKSDLKEIHSHPIALKQCVDYIDENFNGIRLQEKSDTAGAAHGLVVDENRTAGAIGNLRSAKLYGLEVLDTGIETNKKNYTRFLVLAKHGNPAGYGNKASICFELGHFHGALARVLNIFTENNINLTKIQSVPIIGKPKEYSFHLDIEWNSFDSYEKAIHLVLKNCSSLAILGEYERADWQIHNQ